MAGRSAGQCAGLRGFCRPEWLIGLPGGGRWGDSVGKEKPSRGEGVIVRALVPAGARSFAERPARKATAGRPLEACWEMAAGEEGAWVP